MGREAEREKERDESTIRIIVSSYTHTNINRGKVVVPRKHCARVRGSMESDSAGRGQPHKVGVEVAVVVVVAAAVVIAVLLVAVVEVVVVGVEVLLSLVDG